MSPIPDLSLNRPLLRALATPISLYVGGAMIAALISPLPAHSWRWVAVLLLGCGAALLLSGWLTTPGRIAGAAAALVAFATGVAFLTVTQYRFLEWEDEFGPATRVGMLISGRFPLYYDPWLPVNASAALFESALPLALGLAIAYAGWRRWAALGAALGLALGLLLTASRGAWLALTIALLVGALALVRRRRARLARVVVGGGGGIALAALLLGALVAIVRPAAVESLVARALDRAALYRNSLHLALDVPLTGIGGGPVFTLAYSRMQLLIEAPFLTYPHNLLLSVWLWHGLVGLVGFCALALVAGRLVWRAIPALGPVGLGAALGGLAALLHGVTDAPQYDRSTILLASCVIFAIMCAAAHAADPRPLRWVRLERRGRAAALVVAITLLLIAGRGIAAQAAANAAQLRYAQALLGDAGPQGGAALLREAQQWADAGLSVAPDSAALQKARGMIAYARGDYAAAADALGRAAIALPEDQAVIKALGYAEVWLGRVDAGAGRLRGLDRAAEIPQELIRWEEHWRARGRHDLAGHARAAQGMSAP